MTTMHNGQIMITQARLVLYQMSQKCLYGPLWLEVVCTDDVIYNDDNDDGQSMIVYGSLVDKSNDKRPRKDHLQLFLQTRTQFHK